MMGNWCDHNTLYVEMYLREMRSAVEEARRARLVRPPRRLRRRLGGLLVTTGERLAR